MRKALLLCAALAALFVAAFAPMNRVFAQVAPSPVPYAQQLAVSAETFSATGAGGGTPWLALSGQTYCTITFTTVPTTLNITVQGASDAPSLGTQTAVTVTSIGTNGVITNPTAGSQYGGIVVPQALTYIRLYFNTLSGGSGTAAGSISCTPGFGLPTAAPYLSLGSAATNQGGVADVPSPGATPTNAALNIQGALGGYPVNTNPSYGLLQTSPTVTSVSTATTTQVVAAPTNGQSIWVFGAWIVSAGTESAALATYEYGTGTNCGTGTTQLWNTGGNANGTLGGSSGLITTYLANNSIIAATGSMSPINFGFQIPAQNALCVVSSGTTISFRPYVMYQIHG